MSREPFVHTLIRASAGSGKTHQLTNRYLGLIAEGVEPDAILATTFTRKAAGEILDRVLVRLARAAGDAAEAGKLANQVPAFKNCRDGPVALLRRMVRSLHRVRIGTLDSFCVALCGSFALELGLPMGWSIGEDADEDSLRRDALERMLGRQPDDIGRLIPLLSKGDINRSVYDDLLKVIQSNYDVYRDSERRAWCCLHVPDAVVPAQVAAAISDLRAFDFAACGDKRFASARDSDLAGFQREDWPKFLANGLAGKVYAEESTYRNKPIPPGVVDRYKVLIAHARASILRRLAVQTSATWDLLDRFHRELSSLKQATGQLRFDEVTRALADGLERGSLQPEGLAFRLDGSVSHLLLDEFQDTSLPQWRVLKPIAQAITRSLAEPLQSFFCVGDVKQAIYGWRGGMTELFNAVTMSLGPMQEWPLVESRRSAQAIIDVVNKVFGNLSQVAAADNLRDGFTTWGERFAAHTTAVTDVRGYVCMETGPAQEDDKGIDEQRERHCAFVAARIQDLVNQCPGRSIGVLCRSNKFVARMIYELRQVGVDASEEGGNPLTDSPAVELLLSLFLLADHPGHSVAWFHLRNSPLANHLEAFADADEFARRLRHELHHDGYGRFVSTWATRLEPACDRRDLTRLRQFVDKAYAFQPRSTLRTDDFVAQVRNQRVTDPSAANVRVMTIHGAKGLQFDAVVLPELDASLSGRIPNFVVGRHPQSLAVTFVCRYVNEDAQSLLTADERRAFDLDRQHRVEESLSMLYVALTRAACSLYLFVPGKRSRQHAYAWHELLRQTLLAGKSKEDVGLLYEHGDPAWFRQLSVERGPSAAPPRGRTAIVFRNAGGERRRGTEHVAPSRHEGPGRVALASLFDACDESATAAGVLYHAWFEQIGWIEDGIPSDGALRDVAVRIRLSQCGANWPDPEPLLHAFRAWLREPVITDVLSRKAYAGPTQPGYPARLKPYWTESLHPRKVETERRFLVPDGPSFLNGCLDRVVWLGDGERTAAVDVLDYKTDALAPGDAVALAARTEYYRPQMDAYRRAVARLTRLEPERVAVRLVFTSAGRVVEV